MAMRSMCGFVIAIALAFSTTAVARADEDSCWQMIMNALDRSAHSPHARFVSYGELEHIDEDGHTLENVHASITYRDDGLAYVNDERWEYPFVSRYLEPGPPVLGPYGDARDMWLALDSNSPTRLPVIANVHNHPRIGCRDAGAEMLGGMTVRHLLVGEEQRDRLGLRAVWIDPSSLEIKRVIVRGPLQIYGADSIQEKHTDYTVDIEHVDGYSVVHRVWWQYREEFYSQRSLLDAEYVFTNYHFSELPPPGTLPVEAAAR